MPKFFFDVYDGRSALRDEFGIELETLGEVADQAAALLPDMARDLSPDGQARDFAAIVRDRDGQVVYRATLIFRGQWSGPAAAPEGTGDTTSDLLALVEETLETVTGGRESRMPRTTAASSPTP